MSKKVFDESWQDLLISLLRLDTQSTLETGRISQIREAQELIATHARGRGFEVASFRSPKAAEIHTDLVPLSVIEAEEAMGAAFLDSQPVLALRAGNEQPIDRTMVFNFHVDTVAGFWPPAFEAGIFSGRGAVDAKGPGVATLAGIVQAITETPSVLDHIQILVQSVPGEEGGAMGVYGTRALINDGFIGRLNVFAEPSRNVYFDSATSTMTARITVSGEGATDDAPAQGDNSTVILSFICNSMAARLARSLNGECRMCVGGLSTGTAHNRVYGSGVLQMNFAYRDLSAASEIETMVEQSFARALVEFREQFSSLSPFARSAANASRITKLTWTKKGLPALANRDVEMERLLAGVGIKRCPEEWINDAFTCDAIWAQRSGSYAIVFGPGDLVANHAHADGEFVTIADLESHAASIASLVRDFAKSVKENRDG